MLYIENTEQLDTGIEKGSGWSNRRFHGRGRHLGSGVNAAKFTVNVWEKS